MTDDAHPWGRTRCDPVPNFGLAHGDDEMTLARRDGLKRRLLDLYWLVVGTIGLGQPVVGRWDTYGDGPSDDPYSLDWAPTPRR